MALTQNDLKFKMTILPDTAAMKKSITDLGTQITSVSKQASQSLSQQIAAGANPFLTLGAESRQGAAHTDFISKLSGASTRVAAPVQSRKLDYSKGIDALGDALQALNKENISLATSLTSVRNCTVAWVGTLTSFVAIGNPAVFERFQLAVRDLFGVIGQSLAPVLELVTEGVRLFADVLATLLPTGSEVGDSLASIREAFSSFADFIRSNMQYVLAAFHGLLVAIGVTPITSFRALLTQLYVMLASHPLFLLAFAAGTAASLLFGPKSSPAALSSVGAGGRNAQFQGVGQYLQGLAISSFQSPNSPAERTATGVERIVGYLDRNPGRGEFDTWR